MQLPRVYSKIEAIVDMIHQESLIRKHGMDNFCMVKTTLDPKKGFDTIDFRAVFFIDPTNTSWGNETWIHTSSSTNQLIDHFCVFNARFQ